MRRIWLAVLIAVTLALGGLGSTASPASADSLSVPVFITTSATVQTSCSSDDEVETDGTFDGSNVRARAEHIGAQADTGTVTSDSSGSIGLGGGVLGQISHVWSTQVSVSTEADCWLADFGVFAQVTFVIDRQREVTLHAVSTGDGADPQYTITNVITAAQPLSLRPAETDNGPVVPAAFNVTEKVTLPPGEYAYRISAGHQDFDFNPGGISWSNALSTTLTFRDPSGTPPRGGAGGKITGKAKPYVGFPPRLDCGKSQAVLKLKKPKGKPKATKAVIKVGKKKVATIKSPKKNQKVVVKKLKPSKTKLTVQIKPKGRKAISASRTYTPCR